MLKPIRIGLDLDSFLNEHEEISLVRENGNIVGVSTKPEEDIIITFMYINRGELLELSYIYNDKYVHFSNY